MAKHKYSNFQSKWGIHAVDLAEAEGVSPDAIHMRVYLWGSPYQRRAKPTKWEREYGMSLTELCEHYDLSPWTIAKRQSAGIGLDQPSNSDLDWRESKTVFNKPISKPFWLHPDHPAYALARSGSLTDHDVKHIQQQGKNYYKWENQNEA